MDFELILFAIHFDAILFSKVFNIFDYVFVLNEFGVRNSNLVRLGHLTNGED